MTKTATRTKDENVAYGRPRLLTHEEILDAAIEIGLEDLTMKKLAGHLGVGTATLYQYWNNRRELVQAAAVRSLSALDWPKDKGQHWSTYVWEFVDAVTSYLAQSPSLVMSNHAREYGFEVNFRLVEQFLAVLEARGFSAEQGMRLYNMVGIIAFGSAVDMVRQAEFAQHGEKGGETARKQLSSLDADDFPLVGQSLSTMLVAPRDKMRATLHAVLVSAAVERGEDPKDISFRQ